VVLIIGIPFVGSGVYFFTEKKHEYAKAESHHIHDAETEAQHEASHQKHKKKPRRQKVETVNEKKEEETQMVTNEVRVLEHDGDVETTVEEVSEVSLAQEEKSGAEKEEGVTTS
jgi:hypothetical protein